MCKLSFIIGASSNEMWLYGSSSSGGMSETKILDNGAISLAYNMSGSRLLYNDPDSLEKLYSVNIDGNENMLIRNVPFFEEHFTFDSQTNVFYFVHKSNEKVDYINLSNGDSGSTPGTQAKYLDIDENNR